MVVDHPVGGPDGRRHVGVPDHDGRSRADDSHGGRTITGRGALERRDNRFADALTVQKDDVGNLEFPLDAVLANLVQNHCIADATLGHGDHVG